MYDIDDVIKGLEQYLNYPEPLCDIAKKAIDLLKWQDNEIDILKMTIFGYEIGAIKK